MKSVIGTRPLTDWQAVNWRKANKRVRDLRQRIFRASAQGDRKKVRSLQRLMLRSYSIRANSVASSGVAWRIVSVAISKLHSQTLIWSQHSHTPIASPLRSCWDAVVSQHWQWLTSSLCSSF